MNATPPATGPQIKTTKTCIECRRRKIRCDGHLPCNKCVYYEIPICQYEPRKRRKPSSARRCSDVVAEQHRTPADTILRKLFPARSPESLAQLSRQQLLQLIAQTPTQGGLSDHESDRDLGGGEPETEDDEREWNEANEAQGAGGNIADDVNGLSLAVHRRSYMGITSVHAILQTIFRLRPSLQTELKNRELAFTDGWGVAALSRDIAPNVDLQSAAPAVDEETSIDAYFASVHGIAPLLDEATFRATWKQGGRCDRPWLACLNMVLVLGSLCVGGSDESSQIYYQRAKAYLDLDLVARGCTETLQALCLLGGFYMHYKNSPNVAHSIMGLSYRMAIGLGLHRQPANLTTTAAPCVGADRLQLRRRLWWSLFCLDTWGSTTLGRPVLGRWDPDTMDVPAVSPPETSDPLLLSLDCARAFCLVATKIQHRFSRLSPMTIEEITEYDAEVRDWYLGLPLQFRLLPECPSRLVSAQYVMRNRYFNLRLLLYRPVLLRYANAGYPLESLPISEQYAIQTCREIACEAIDVVAAAAENSIDRLRAWSAVWYLYQASMVLLLNIITDPENAERSVWQGCVRKAVLFFERAEALYPAAARSRQVIGSLLEACTAPNAAPDAISESMDLEDPIVSHFWAQIGRDMFVEEGWSWDLPSGNLDIGPDSTSYEPFDNI